LILLYLREKCKKFSHGILPSQNFGPSVMCSYCGSLWNTMDYTIRISQGKPLSKSIKKIIRIMNDSEKRIPKIQRSLVKKCLKNEMNKLVLKCSVCKKNTKIYFNKPKREKAKKASTESIQSLKRRRKKKSKDKTAGLNVSGISSLNAKDITEKSTEMKIKKVGNTTNFKTPTQKLKKLNVNRLKDIVNKGAAPPRRRSLHSFLTELC
ncbi:hypothetical protein WN48_07345, partial [Eufriesea mexicana]